MPFQISLSHYTRSPGIIYRYDAGNNVNSICGNNITITLQANVVGDLFRHTFYWEQVSGSQVTWLTPRDRLSVDIQFTPSDDKQFRFYIDKGTSREKYADTWVFATPTSVSENFIYSFSNEKYLNDNMNDIIQGGTPDMVVDTTNPNYALFDQFPSDTTLYCSNLTNRTYYVNFNLPLNTTNLSKAILQKRLANGTWSNIREKDVSQLSQTNNSFLIDDIGWYRILLQYDITKETTRYTASKPFYATLTGLVGMVVYDYFDLELSSLSDNSIDNYNVVEWKLKKELYLDYSINEISSLYYDNINNYNITERKLLVREETDTLQLDIHSISENSIYNYSVTGGSQIGG